MRYVLLKTSVQDEPKGGVYVNKNTSIIEATTYEIEATTYEFAVIKPLR